MNEIGIMPILRNYVSYIAPQFLIFLTIIHELKIGYGDKYVLLSSWETIVEHDLIKMFTANFKVGKWHLFDS